VRDRQIVTRARLKAAGVLAAFAFLVGLSAPASGLADPAAPTTAVPNASAPALAGPAPADTPPSSTLGTDLVPAAIAPGAPTDHDLHPVTVTAAQQTFTPSTEQLANAKAIVDAGKGMGLPPRAWEIAVATSLQESNLKNLGHLGAANDHDSLGLFQQRPSSGWGTPSQVQDPTYASTAFYHRLVQVPGWDSLPLTTAAQKVQVSAYPDRYATHEQQAADMIDALYGSGPYADTAASVR